MLETSDAEEGEFSHSTPSFATPASPPSLGCGTVLILILIFFLLWIFLPRPSI